MHKVSLKMIDVAFLLALLNAMLWPSFVAAHPHLLTTVCH